MAKTGFWLRGANGKLAGATIYQQNGETVMREVVSPSNPKTEKQIIQRIVMHTVMQAYSKMKEICDHSFEGQKQGQQTMSYFMQQNIQYARQKIADMQAQGVDFYDMYNYVPLGVKGFTPNQYQVAMGSLPQVQTTFDDEDAYHALVEAVKTNTYQAVIDALGLQRGDQLTFIFIKTTQAGSESFGQNQFHFCRVILDPTNEDYSQAALSVPFLTDGHKVNLPSIRNENADAFNFEIDASDGLKFTLAGADICVAAAVIVSRKQGDNWCRSTTYLAYRGSVGQTYSLGECLDMAAEGVTSQIYAPSDQYLNNAGQGGGAAAASGETPGGGSGVTVNAVTVDGQQATVGTTKTITLANGTSFPVTKSVVVSILGAGAGSSVVVRAAGSSAAVAQQDIADGTANISHAWAKDTVYSLFYVDANDEASALGYSFKFAEASSNDNGDGADDH